MGANAFFEDSLCDAPCPLLCVPHTLLILMVFLLASRSTLRECGKGELLAHWRKCNSSEQDIAYTEPFNYDQCEGNR